MERYYQNLVTALFLCLSLIGNTFSQNIQKKTLLQGEVKQDAILILDNEFQMTSCVSELKNTILQVQLDLGERFVWNQNVFSIDVTFDVVLKDAANQIVTSFQKNIALNELHPEAIFYKEISVNEFQQTDKVEMTIVGLNDSESMGQQLRLTVNLLNDVVLNEDNVSLSYHSITQDESVIFDWNSNCMEIEDYQIQIVRLYNISETNQLAGNEKQAQVLIDWNTALTLETGSDKTEFSLTIAEGTGYYAWRIRPIGSMYPNGVADARNWGNWIADSPIQLGMHNLTDGSQVSGIFFYNQFENDKNWVFSRNFSEGDPTDPSIRFAEGISYGTGLGTAVQSQGKSQTDNEIIANQIIYDFSGRAAIQTMSVPTGKSNFLYKENLATSGNEAYSAKHFDENNNFQNPIPLEGTISNYYSDVNPDQTIPSADGYPFSRALFDRDGTGRIREQGGPGETFRIKQGTSHTLRTFYASASEEELIRVLGDEAPEAESVRKVITVDGNNVASVSYVNKNGQAIITCLAKSLDVGNLLNIGNEPDESFTVEETLDRSIGLGEFGKSTSTTVAFATPTALHLTYELKLEDFRFACENLCVECDYQYEVRIYDGNNIVYEKSNVLTNQVCDEDEDTTLVNEVINLKVGSYRIEKRIFSNNVNPETGLTFLEEHQRRLISKIDNEFDVEFGDLIVLLNEGRVDEFYSALDGSINREAEVNFDRDTRQNFIKNLSCGEISIPVYPCEPVCDGIDFELIFKEKYEETNLYGKDEQGNYLFFLPAEVKEGQFNQLIENMLNEPAKEYKCTDLTNCWTKLVTNYKLIKESYAQTAPNNQFNLFDAFLDCAGRMYIGYSNNSIDFIENGHKYVNYSPDPNNSCEQFFTSEHGNFATWGNDLAKLNQEDKHWENFFRCLNSFPVKATDDKINERIEFTRQGCLEMCEKRSEEFKLALVSAYQEENKVFEGTTILDPNTLDYKIVTPSLADELGYDYSISDSGLVCQQSIFDNICELSCKLDRIDLENDGIKLGTDTQLQTVKSVFTDKLKISFNSPLGETDWIHVGGNGLPNGESSLDEWGQENVYILSGNDLLTNVVTSNNTGDDKFISGVTSSSNEGNIIDVNSGGFDIWVAKIDVNGTVVWKKTIGTSSDDNNPVSGLKVTNDSKVVAVMESINKITILKLSVIDGSYESNEVYSNQDGDIARVKSFEETPNGFKMVFSTNNNNNQTNIGILNFDFSGNLIKSTVIDDDKSLVAGIELNEEIIRFLVEENGNYFRIDYNIETEEKTLVKLDFNGNQVLSIRRNRSGKLHGVFTKSKSFQIVGMNEAFETIWEYSKGISQGLAKFTHSDEYVNGVNVFLLYSDDSGSNRKNHVIALDSEGQEVFNKNFDVLNGQLLQGITIDDLTGNVTVVGGYPDTNQGGQAGLPVGGVNPVDVSVKYNFLILNGYLYDCPRAIMMYFKWEPFTIDPEIDYTVLTCDEYVANKLKNDIYSQLAFFQEQKRNELIAQYKSNCGNMDGIQDVLKIKYELDYHHYTLAYYDRAGNLVRTVPPQGVDITNTSRLEHPEHGFVTKYEYNSLGQMIKQHTPDGGVVTMFYDALSRLRFSQNDKQLTNGTYSYLKYDYLGRVIEAGQSSEDVVNLQGHVDDNLFPVSGEERSFTVYAESGNVEYETGIKQRYLNNRISYIYNDDDVKTYYSYDPHGNVEWMIQDLPVTGKNYLRYEYDLISGKVLQVHMNEGRADAFHHRYFYDENQAITKVETSRDGFRWDTDAEYEYYVDGKLKRKTLGHDKVQGLDFVYTINGWLKGINHPDLGLLDPSNDGENGIGKDAFGMVLSYHENDFNRKGSAFNSTHKSLIGSVSDHKNLYNGNIASWTFNSMDITGGGERQYEGEKIGFQYVYDKLNRIREANFMHSHGNWIDNDDYKTRYTYDYNGNILTLNRNAFLKDNNRSMDDLRYDYNHINANGLATGVAPDEWKNQLKYVKDIVPGVTHDDVTNQGVDNYAYDEIGQLIKDRMSDISNIEWTVTNKVRKITKTDGEIISFNYDPTGNRVSKHLVRIDGTEEHTEYLRDASGNPMATYKKVKDDATGEFVYSQEEVSIFGASREGIYKPHLSMDKVLSTTNKACFTCDFTRKLIDKDQLEGVYKRKVDAKLYEISDHLGNVRAVVGDRLLRSTENDPLNFLLSGAWKKDTLLTSGANLSFGIEQQKLRITCDKASTIVYKDIDVIPGQAYEAIIDVDMGTANSIYFQVNDFGESVTSLNNYSSGIKKFKFVSSKTKVQFAFGTRDNVESTFYIKGLELRKLSDETIAETNEALSEDWSAIGSGATVAIGNYGENNVTQIFTHAMSEGVERVFKVRKEQKYVLSFDSKASSAYLRTVELVDGDGKILGNGTFTASWRYKTKFEFTASKTSDEIKLKFLRLSDGTNQHHFGISNLILTPVDFAGGTFENKFSSTEFWKNNGESGVVVTSESNRIKIEGNAEKAGASTNFAVIPGKAYELKAKIDFNSTERIYTSVIENGRSIAKFHMNKNEGDWITTRFVASEPWVDILFAKQNPENSYSDFYVEEFELNELSDALAADAMNEIDEDWKKIGIQTMISQSVSNDSEAILVETKRRNEGIERNFSTIAGQEYDLHFDVSAGELGTYIVSEILDDQGELLGAKEMVKKTGRNTFTYSFVAKGYRTKLKFSRTNNDAIVRTFAVDNLILTPVEKVIISDRFNASEEWKMNCWGNSNVTYENQRVKITSIGDYCGAELEFDVIPGEPYRISADIDKGDLSYLFIGLYERGSWRYFTDVTSPINGTNYIDFVPASSKVSIRFGKRKNQVIPVETSFYVENVKLEKLLNVLEHDNFEFVSQNWIPTSAGISNEISKLNNNSTLKVSAIQDGTGIERRFKTEQGKSYSLLFDSNAMTCDKISLKLSDGNGNLLAPLYSHTNDWLSKKKLTFTATGNTTILEVLRLDASSGVKEFEIDNLILRETGGAVQTELQDVVNFNVEELYDWKVQFSNGSTQKLENGKLKVSFVEKVAPREAIIRYMPTKVGKAYEISCDVDLMSTQELALVIWKHFDGSSSVFSSKSITNSGKLNLRFVAQTDLTRFKIEHVDDNATTFTLDNFIVKEVNVDHYIADVKSVTDYYPFGMAMPGRSASTADYRYGFNGMEKDDEVKGEGNSYTTHFRQYDPRLGRWLSLDPVTHNWESPYVSMNNSPILLNDPDGDCPTCITGGIAGALIEYAAIVYENIFIKGQSLSEGLTNISWWDLGGIIKEAGVGAITGAIDGGASSVIRFASSKIGRKVLKYLIDKASDALFTFMKEYAGDGFDKSDMTRMLISWGLGDLVKGLNPLKKVDFVSNTKLKNSKIDLKRSQELLNRRTTQKIIVDKTSSNHNKLLRKDIIEKTIVGISNKSVSKELVNGIYPNNDTKRTKKKNQPIPCPDF